ncbi:hypothetical protein LTS18_014926, partial [Coniosporium uncinatum]
MQSQTPDAEIPDLDLDVDLDLDLAARRERARRAMAADPVIRLAILLRRFWDVVGW